MRALRALGCAALLAAAGCAYPAGPAGAPSIDVTRPAWGSSVRLPADVRWTVSGPRPAAYAVFVDREPMPPGETVRYFKDDDGTFVTADTGVLIAYVGDVTGAYADRRRAHEVAVVPLDERGRRIGERAGHVSFVVRRG